jgi:CDP-diacylglycerol---glycerol-3-phosphate 3-phosphatidyltransferase
MLTLYQIKPQFQQLLRPLVNFLAKQNVTPNQVTWIALGLSIATGLTIARYTDLSSIWLILPPILLLRMALNAIDGMLAREHNLITASGGILNELGDVLSDIALYWPLALLPGIQRPYVITFLFLAMLTEMTGILGWSVDRQRHYEGPMGKSDRAMLVSVISVVEAVGGMTEGWNWMIWPAVWCSIFGLQIWTIRNRIRAMLHLPGDHP